MKKFVLFHNRYHYNYFYFWQKILNFTNIFLYFSNFFFNIYKERYNVINSTDSSLGKLLVLTLSMKFINYLFK